MNKFKTKNLKLKTNPGFTPALILPRFCFFKKNFSLNLDLTNNTHLNFLFAAKRKKAEAKLVFGFTLIELMVSVSIFTIVALVSISSLIAINDANKKAQTIRAIIDNLNFAVENIARNLRVGTAYHCDYTLADNGYPSIWEPRNCEAIPSSSIAFESYNGDPTDSTDQIVFALNENGQIMKSTKSGAVGTFSPLTPYDPSASYQPLTIDYLHFYVSGAASNDGKQPRAVIVVGGTAYYNNKVNTRFQIETSVSQRRIDS